MQRLTVLGLVFACLQTAAADGNRLAYLQQSDPYYVSQDFPKLVTPQWVGEDGVDAVVVLAIDDMRGFTKWEQYLRPILARLKKIDGRAPVSIMTCNVDPQQPHLQRWLAEGVSIEVHTVDHPCPILNGSDFDRAKSTYDRCIDLLAQIANNRPVAFRTPCCDSLNTVSPRLFSEIFNRNTTAGGFLEVDSSVFNVFRIGDRELPEKLLLNEDGSERFARYIPSDRLFVNTIENYPYPYVIGRLCWEFPCMVPSDWAAQHLQRPNNPRTVEDWKRGLDATVIKQGTFNLVFHPHGWIRNEQVNEFIDYAVTNYGNRVKFLTFREAADRLSKYLLKGQALRDRSGEGNGVRLLDLNDDGYLDVVVCNPEVQLTRVWNPAEKTWSENQFPKLDLTKPGLEFGVLQPSGEASALFATSERAECWHWRDGTWVADEGIARALKREAIETTDGGRDRGVRLRDLDRDGVCEILFANENSNKILRLSDQDRRLESMPFRLPDGVRFVDEARPDCGLRFVDLDKDGFEDIVYSNESDYGIYLFESPQSGWSRKIMAGTRTGKSDEPAMIVRGRQNNGAWFHSGYMVVQNEDTAVLKDLIWKRSFDDLIGRMPGPKSPEDAIETIRLSSGLRVQLVAAEPLTQDPIAIDWGPDGKLWVVEMADYPLGMDAQGRPGGRVRYLEDTNGDGRYNKSTLFLDKIPYPTGVTPWKSGILVSSAPDIFYAEDTDGDGKADKRQTLYRGFGEGNQQHRVNGFVWGLDGWLHCANGDSGGRVTSLATAKTIDLSGRDFRIQPERGLIELESGRTQFGRCRDDFGNWFGCNNSNPMFQVVLDDRALRGNPHVVTPAPTVQVSVTPGAAAVFPTSKTLARFNDLDKVNRFTSACSVTIYRDTLLPFSGNSFVCEPVHNLVHREVLDTGQVSFRSRRGEAEQASEFLSSSDNWFRPTMVRTGPDGAIYIVDMYRLVIEHPEWIPKQWQEKLDLRSGSDRGRIYRVVPEGKGVRAVPKFGNRSGPELAELIDHPNGWVRDTAHRLLLSEGRPTSAALSALEQIVESGTDPGKAQALLALKGLGQLRGAVIAATLSDPNPNIRRIAVGLAASSEDRDLSDRLTSLASDASPLVRFELALLLDAKQRSAAKTWMALARASGSDRYLQAALSISCLRVISDLVKQIEPKDLEDVPRTLLHNVYASAAAAAEDHIPSFFELLGTGSAVPVATRLRFAEDWLGILARRKLDLGKLSEAAPVSWGHALTNLNQLVAEANELAFDDRAEIELRVAAVKLLGRDHDNSMAAKLLSLIAPQNRLEIQHAAIASLGVLGHESSGADLVERWKVASPSIRAEIVDQLLARPAWTEALLERVAEKEISVRELGVSVRQRLAVHPSKSVRDAWSNLETPLSQNLSSSARIKDVLRLTGTPEQGQVVFKKLCSSCHQVQGVGKNIGPDLAAVNRSSQAILLSVLEPNRAVESKYTSYQVVTLEGRTYSGLLHDDSANQVTLIDQKGESHTIARAELELLKSTGQSLMPNGFGRELSNQQLTDLVAFVTRSTLVPKTFAGNQPALIEPELLRGEFYLQGKNGEIYGSEIRFEEKYGNIGFWSNQGDHVVWTIDVEKAGDYSVVMDWACDSVNAGNAFVIEVSENAIRGLVQATGSWDRYRQSRVGQLRLAQGKHRVVFRPDGPVRGYLIDLRGLRITPK